MNVCAGDGSFASETCPFFPFHPSSIDPSIHPSITPCRAAHSLHLGHWNLAARTSGRTAEQRATVPLTETNRPTTLLLRPDMGVRGSRLVKRMRRQGPPPAWLWRGGEGRQGIVCETTAVGGSGRGSGRGSAGLDRVLLFAQWGVEQEQTRSPHAGLCHGHSYLRLPPWGSRGGGWVDSSNGWCAPGGTRGRRQRVVAMLRQASVSAGCLCRVEAKSPI